MTHNIETAEGESDENALLVLLVMDIDKHFQRLVEQYSIQMYKWAYYYVQTEAEDAVQRVMMNVYMALKKYSAKRILSLKLKPWLHKITENECFKMLQERKKQMPGISLDFLNGMGIEYLAGDLGMQIEDIVEQRQQLQDAFFRLSEKDRATMYLRYIVDMTEAEIALELNEPVGTVKARISRARKKLHGMLDSSTGAEEG